MKEVQWGAGILLKNVKWRQYSAQLNIMIGLTEGGGNLVNILSDYPDNLTPHMQLM